MYKKKFKPKCLIVDVDGVLTSGHMIYSENGKKYKLFGPDDSDALKIIDKFLKVIFITADKRGYKISKKRIYDDMKMNLLLVSNIDRLKILSKKFNLKECIFIGDGIFDHFTMKKSGYSITMADSLDHVKKNANFITKRRGGNRAVAEATLHILKKFFNFKIENKISL
tara:strand:- start:75 stop:578 length:504 start_codon:yes stop_codon:yes gene_type:complete